MQNGAYARGRPSCAAPRVHCRRLQRLLAWCV